MNYILSPASIRYIFEKAQFGDSLFYKQIPPDYIVSACYQKQFSIQPFDDSLSVIFEPTDDTKTWPDRDTVNQWLTPPKRYAITNENWDSVMRVLENTDIVYYCTNLLSSYKDYLKTLSNTQYEVSYFEKDIYKPDDSVPIKSTVNNEATFLHYLGSFHSKESNYRRFKLNSFLSKNKVIDTVQRRLTSDTTDIVNKPYKVILASDSRWSKWLIQKAKKEGSTLYYDRTDNWSALGPIEKKEELALIKASKKIFCSSNFLFNSLPEEAKSKATVIPNGCDVKPYNPMKKFDKKTAVYIGKNTNKIDFQTLNKLAQENPSWEFRIYGTQFISTALEKNIVVYPFIDERQLHLILSQCHVGLIPFLQSNWTAGMLPLKLFHYINAHLPVGFLGCAECNYYPDVAFNLENVSLEEIASKNINAIVYDNYLQKANWDEKFQQIEGVMNEKY